MAIVHPYGNCVVFNDSFTAEDEKNMREYVKEFQDSGRGTSVHRIHILLTEIDRLRTILRQDGYNEAMIRP